MTPQDRGKQRREQQLAILFALYECCGDRPNEQACVDELAEKLGLSVETVDARLVELRGLAYVESFETGPCYKLSESARDEVERRLLEGPDTELRRKATRLQELRMAFLHQVYELAGHSVANTVSPEAAGEPIGVTDGDDLYGLVWWLEKRGLITRYGHVVTLRAEGIELIEQAQPNRVSAPARVLDAVDVQHGRMSSYPSSVTEQQFDPAEVDLLRVMVEGEEAASREGLRDEPFRVLVLNEGLFLAHKGLHLDRRHISRRAFLALREAGLFVIVSETRSLIRFYLARDASRRLEEQPSPGIEAPRPKSRKAARRPGRPAGPYLIQSREEIEGAYRNLWKDAGRRPHWGEVAKRLIVGEKTLLRARERYGLLDAHSIRLEQQE